MSDRKNKLPYQSKLRVIKKEEEEITAPPPPLPAKKKKGSRKPGAGASHFGVRFLSMSVGTFLFAMFFLGGFIYHQVNDLSLLTGEQARLVRAVAVVCFYVILVIEAFHEDMIQGVLSIFIPPYVFVYGLLFADAGPVRGLTMAMLVFLAAEVFYTPTDAFVPRVSATLNGWIEGGQQKLIEPDRKDAGFE